MDDAHLERRRRIVDETVAALRIHGCYCDPEVRFNRSATIMGLDVVDSVAHEPWCPLHRAALDSRRPFPAEGMRLYRPAGYEPPA